MFDITSTLAGFGKGVTEFEKATDKAVVDALNWTAWDARQALMDEIDDVFDMPTTWTKRSIYVKAASLNKPTASVAIAKGRFNMKTNGSLTPISRVMEPHLLGGSRKVKAFEKRLQGAGILGRNQLTVPGQKVRLNRFGNMTRGQITKILSNVNAHREGGYQMNTRKGSAGRHFVKYDDAGQAIGIWRRTGKRSVIPVLVFVDGRMKYGRVFEFYSVVKRVRDREYPKKLKRAMKKHYSNLKSNGSF